MKPFAHFVVTRFNLRRKAELPKNWLERRIDLFEQYCLPSIINQSEKDFYWLPLFDSASPKILQDKIIDWQALCPQLNPMYCGDWMHKTIGGCIEEFIRTKTEERKATYTLTTRIDNDDGMHVHFVKNLHSEALDNISKKVGALILDYPTGIRLHVPKKKFYLWPRRCAPFISLLRKYDPEGKIMTVHSFPGGHDQVWKHCKVKPLHQNKPYWLQTIHDVNISNVLTGKEKPVQIKDYPGFNWLEL